MTTLAQLRRACHQLNNAAMRFELALQLLEQGKLDEGTVELRAAVARNRSELQHLGDLLASLPNP